EGGIEGADVGADRNALYVPAVGLEALSRVVAPGEAGRPIDGDAVVVVDPDQMPELQVTGKRACLVGHPFHQVAVRGHEVGAVIDDLVPGAIEDAGEVRFREGHPYGVSDTLAQRPRGGLDPRRRSVL